MNATLLKDAVVASRVATWYSVQVPCVRVHTDMSSRLYGTVTERMGLAGRFETPIGAMLVAAELSKRCGTAIVKHHGDTFAYYVVGRLVQ